MKSTNESSEHNLCYEVFIHAMITVVLVLVVNVSSVHANGTVNYEMPGQLIDVGTHKLHINCKGSGTPAVIIDSGLGSLSLEWFNIQNTLSHDTMICTYDRAGYGWSEPGPLPRTSKQISSELNVLLTRANIPAPYILVGHSFGGFNMRYYTSMHPDNVAALVLVDASHPEQFDRLPQPDKKIEPPKPEGAVTIRISRPIMHAQYPHEVKMLAYRMLMMNKSHETRWNELDYFEISARELRAVDQIPDDIPVIVVSRGKRVWPHTALGDELEKTWHVLQEELSYLSKYSIQVVAQKSGHSVHLDQPELVTSMIGKTIHTARRIHTEQLAMQSQESSDNYESPVNDYFHMMMTDAYIAHANLGQSYTASRLHQVFAAVP